MRTKTILLLKDRRIWAYLILVACLAYIFYSQGQEREDRRADNKATHVDTCGRSNDTTILLGNLLRDVYYTSAKQGNNTDEELGRTRVFLNRSLKDLYTVRCELLPDIILKERSHPSIQLIPPVGEDPLLKKNGKAIENT